MNKDTCKTKSIRQDPS